MSDDVDADGERAARALRRLRDAGWSVAIHNDYMLDGIKMTFWLFTHPSGVWVKGEGARDIFALMHAEAEAGLRFRQFGIRA